MTDTTTALSSPYYAAAVEYASHGWHVVQGRPDDRRPRLGGDAWAGSTDPQLLTEWWSARPSDLVGVGLGSSNLFVIDVDMHENDEGEIVNGFASFERLLELLRIDWDELLHATVVSRSGGGGMHFIFQEPELPKDQLRRLIGWLPGVDLLCGRSYLVLPPSYHNESGQPYVWESQSRPWRLGVSSLPPKLKEKVEHALITRGRNGQTDELTSTDLAQIFREGSTSGHRNTDLTRLVGWLRRRLSGGPDQRERIREQLESWRDRCRPPYRGALEDLEFERTFTSAINLPHVDPVLPDWGRPKPIQHDRQTEVPEMTSEALARWAYPLLAPHIRYSREEGMIYRWRGSYWQAGGPRHEDVPALLDELGFCDALRSAVDTTTTRLLAEGADRNQQLVNRTISEWNKWRGRMVEPKTLISVSLRVAGSEELGVSRLTWDSIPHLLHVINGAIDLETGVLHAHDSERMNWSLARAVYDATAQPRDPGAALGLETLGPAWQRMLELLTADEALHRYLQCALGVGLFGDNRSKAMFILHGQADNGKTTMLNAIMALLGVADRTYPMTGVNTYASSVEKHVLCESKSGPKNDHPAGLAAALLRRMIVMSQEYTAQDRLRLETVKSITGNEIISARFMHQNFFEMPARCTPWLATNEELQLGAFDPSIRTRIKPIELEGQIPAATRRPISVVSHELAHPEERTKLLTWLVIGARACASGQDGLVRYEPESVRKALTEMIFEQDSVLAWIDARCVALATGTEPELVMQFEQRHIRGTEVSLLYRDYQIWSQAHGHTPATQVTFTRRVNSVLLLNSSLKIRDTTADGRVRMLPLALKQLQ